MENITMFVFRSRVGELRRILDIQCTDGNWNYDPYMHGMANGLILSLSVMEDVYEPNFLEAPKKWIRDIIYENKVVTKRDAITEKYVITEKEIEDLFIL